MIRKFFRIIKIACCFIRCFPRLVRIAKLTKKGNYTATVALCERLLSRNSGELVNPDDIIALQGICKAYENMGEVEKGFEYRKQLVPYMTLRQVNEYARYYILPEPKPESYGAVCYRCQYFLDNNKYLSPQLKNRFTQIISYCEQQRNIAISHNRGKGTEKIH